MVALREETERCRRTTGRFAQPTMQRRDCALALPFIAD
tara:strand:- start:522 stop:635 length:114 start_codon:yes stop_codon:yes gene_type:complete